MTAEFAWGSIRELTGLLRDGKASALELLEGQLARINGIQLGGRRWRDGELLAVARAVEPVAGGFQPPPAFP